MSTPKNSLANKSKAWSGRFAEPVNALVQAYTSSLLFDQRLALVDIAGSLAHAEMLAAQKIISKADFLAIQKGMAQIEKEIIAGKFEWQLALEDVHLNIEARLTKLIGDA
jgi:argininosuccinate lyase